MAKHFLLKNVRMLSRKDLIVLNPDFTTIPRLFKIVGDDMIPICAASKSHSGVSSLVKKRIDQRALSIDISDQQFRLLPAEVLAARETIEHLIADANIFSENAMKMPLFPRLKTLTLNDNKIRNISTFLQNISSSCPNLQTLSLTGNPGWPSILNSKYKKFRKTTMKMLPKLRNLDGISLKRKLSTSSEGSSASSICSSDSLFSIKSTGESISSQ